MAGALAFNVLIAVVPLFLFLVGVAGFFLAGQVEEITSIIVDSLLFFLPPAQGVDLALTSRVRPFLATIVEERAGFSLLGGLALLWISTRLVAGVRVVMREIFEVGYDRGILLGKLFDLIAVLVGGGLVLLNVGATIAVRAMTERGFFGIQGGLFFLLPILAGQLVSFASAWFLFLLLYQHIPARPVPFRAAALGATFTAIAYEGLKSVFAWYATSLADYSNAYGSLAAAAALFIWIYYSAVVFILGGQVARSYEVQAEDRMKRDRSRGVVGSGSVPGATALLLLLSSLLVPVEGRAQGLSPFRGIGEVPGYLSHGEGVVFGSASLDRNLSLARPLVDHDGPYIVVHIAENRVLLLEGTEVVWSAPAGTGHGFQLEGQGQAWTFTTPVGMFHVLRKEKDPVWIAPDWYYVQRNLAIPRAQDRARIPGTLGTSALFLGDGIAIHGTDRPDLLLAADPEDRRVSHGCIRLTNEAARELYHRVRVGTPVLIF